MSRHPLDLLSLVSGTLFAVLGLLFLLGRIDITSVALGAIWPIPLLVLGLVLAAIGARRSPAE